MPVRIAVILPTYNEASTVPVLLRRFAQVSWPDVVERPEIWLVDDESPDGTAVVARQVARDLGIEMTVLSGPKRGLGAAYLRAIEHLREREDIDVVVTMDADGQHPVEEVPGLVTRLLVGDVDVVIASRWTAGSMVEGLTMHRVLLSRAGNLAIRFATGVPLADNTTAFRAWRSWVLRGFDAASQTTIGYGIQPAMIADAARRGTRFAEVPTHFPRRQSGTSKLPKGEVWRSLRNLRHLRKAARSGRDTRVGG